MQERLRQNKDEKYDIAEAIIQEASAVAENVEHEIMGESGEDVQEYIGADAWRTGTGNKEE